MASRIKGITIEIGGNTTKLQKALQGVNSQITRTNTALRDVDKLLKFNPGNTELLRQKQQMLGTQIQDTKTKLQQLKAAQDSMRASGVDKNSAEFQALQREIIETENKLKSLEGEFKNFGSVASQQIIAAGNRMQEVGRNISKVGDSIASVGSKMTRNVTMPIVAIGGAAVKTAADYDAAMSEVRAITGATDEDFQRLSDTARQWGTDSVFGAEEVAGAYKYMGMAGWDAQQMLDGLPGVLNLAAASGEDLAMVSDIVTDGLTAFGYGAEDAARFADVLAAAATNSNTNVAMMGEAFKFAAPIAGSLGYSIEDVAVAMGLMANAGIKSSMAGTTLRTILQNMTNPTETQAHAMELLGVSLEDGEGNMLSFREVMDQLRTGFGELKIPQEELTRQMTELDAAFDDGTLSEEQYAAAQDELMRRAYGAEGALKAQAAAQLGGARSMSGLLAIINAAPADYEKLTNAINNSKGAAEGMADVMQDNLKGELKKLKNNLKEVGIQFGTTMMPSIRKVVDQIKDLVKWLQNLSPKQREQVVRIAAIAAATGPILVAGGKVISMFGKLVTGAGKVVTGFGKLTTVMIAHPYAAAAVGAVALAAGITKIVDAMTETPYEAFSAKMATIREEMASVNEMTAQYQQLDATRRQNIEAVAAEMQHSQSLKAELDGLLASDRELTAAEQERANFIVSTLMESLGIEYDKNGNLIEQYQNMAGEIDALMEKQRQKAFLAANEEMYFEAIKREEQAHREAREAYNAYMEAMTSLQPLMDAQTAAQNALADAQDRYAGTADSTGTLFQTQEMALSDATMAYESARAEVEALYQEFVAADSAASGYTATIANYQAAAAAIQSGSDGAAQAVERLNQNFITASTGTATALANQVTEANAIYEELRLSVENGYLEAEDAAVQGALKLVEDSLAEFDKLPEEAKAAVDPLGTSLQQGIEAARGNVQTASQTITRAGVDTMAQEGRAAQGSGENTGRAYAQGIASKEGEVRAAARQLANAANQEMKAVQMIKSPSRRWVGYGEDTGEGYVIGMLNKVKAAQAAANKLAVAPDISAVNTSAAPFASQRRAQTVQTETRFNTVLSLLSDLVQIVAEGGDVYIDRDVLVGEVAPGINRNLGIRFRGRLA